MGEGKARSKNRDDYPLTLKVSEVAEILRVDLHKAYEMVRGDGFPAIFEGRRIIIPRDAFFRWLDNCGQNPRGINSTQEVLAILSELVAAHDDDRYGHKNTREE